MSSSPPPGTAADARSPHDEQIRKELMERFAVLAEVCSRFSRDIYLRSGGPTELDNEETIRRNASIARRDFGDRLVEILTVVYFKRSVGFPELLKLLGGMSRRDLTRKLQILQAQGLVESAGPFRSNTAARYSLTHKGALITRLGEPVLLYLRLAEGWTTPLVEQPVKTEAEEIQESKLGETSGA